MKGRREVAILGAVVAIVAVIVSVRSPLERALPSTPSASSTVAPAVTPTPGHTATSRPLTASPTPSPDLGVEPRVPEVEGVEITVVQQGRGKPLAKGTPGGFRYTGWLGGFESEQKFDSSWEHDPPSPLPLTIGVGQVIPGWDRGLIGMRPGEIRRLKISPEMAYGEDGRPPAIPPNSTLYFEVEYVPYNP